MKLEKSAKNLIKGLLGKGLADKVYKFKIDLEDFFNSFGSNVECPICLNSAKKFLPFNGRNNAMCRNCKSLERHRLLYLFLKNKTSFFSLNLKVLHFAPEFCLSKQIRKCPNIEYITADLMTSFLHNIEIKPDFIMSVTDIKFSENYFDVVICNHVLEHVIDDKQAMGEIFRVLKPGGFAILQVPMGNFFKTKENFNLTASERKVHYGEVDHVRLYGLDYQNRLEQVGFKVEVSEYVNELDHKRFVLTPWEKIFQCFK